MTGAMPMTKIQGSPTGRRDSSLRWSDGNKERGVVLVVALLMLLVLTLIGIAATRGTSLEEKMAGNAQDYQAAFQAAEAGLVNCEDFLNQVALPSFDNTGGLYKLDAGSDTKVWDTWTTSDWLSAKTREYDGPALDDVAKNPRCVIEELPAVPPPGASLAADVPAQILMYRLTVQAWGASDKTTVRLQTTYER